MYKSKAKQAKYERCVKKVKTKDSRVRSPHAVCAAAMKKKKR